MSNSHPISNCVFFKDDKCKHGITNPVEICGASYCPYSRVDVKEYQADADAWRGGGYYIMPGCKGVTIFEGGNEWLITRAPGGGINVSCDAGRLVIEPHGDWLCIRGVNKVSAMPFIITPPYKPY